jgi:subtilisin-like proprotein convertase family protein
MKTNSIKVLGGMVCGLALGLASASASLSYSYSGFGQQITDGSSVGITSVATVSGTGSIASSGDNVSVTLNLSRGNIGDLVAYLSFSGVTVQLLNRPGTGGNPSALGYTGNSSFTFNPVTLSDGNSTSVDSYGGGSVSSAVSYNPSAGTSGFQAFNGQSSAAGNWTLFFADLSGGDGANVTTLNGWSLDITAVPEPVNLAMVIFGVGFIAVGAVRVYRSSRKATISPLAT